MPPQSPNPQPVPQGQYDFITEPTRSAGGSPLSKLSGGGSKLARLALLLGGLFVLLIIFSFVKGLLAGPGLIAYVGVVQDQQELIHLMDGVTQQQAAGQQGLSTTDKYFAITAKLSLTSSQSQLLKYLAANNTKVSPKMLSLKVSSAIDQQLAAALAATTYDQTFKEVARAKLTTYSTDLQRVFQQSKGTKGSLLLQSNYTQAQLLLTQLDAPATH